VPKTIEFLKGTLNCYWIVTSKNERW